MPTTCRSSLTSPRQSASWWSFGPERRRAHELGALEAVAQVVERQEEVLRAGLGEGHGAAVAAAHDLLEGVARAEVDDVDGHLRGLGEADDAVDALALEDRVARDAVVAGVGQAGLGVGVGDDVDGHAVLGVHEDEPAVRAVWRMARKMAPSSERKTPG